MPKAHITFEFNLPSEEREHQEIINAHKGFHALRQISETLYKFKKGYQKYDVPLTEESVTEMILECYSHLNEVGHIVEMDVVEW